MVAEVATDLTHDRRYREGQEVRAARGIESIHGMHEADPGDLGEVVEGFSAAAELAGDVIGQGYAPADQFLAQGEAFRRARRRWPRRR